MNKSELVDAISKEADLTKKDAEEALDAVLSNVKESLARGESVTLVGFGTFGVARRAARPGRNPQTGERIQIPAKNVVKFKPGKGLSERVGR